MLGTIRARLSYSNVMATVAVFVALGGSAIAATSLPKNSVGTKQLRNNAVTKAKIKNLSVGRSKLTNGAVGPSQIASQSVTTGKIAGGAVNAGKLAAGAVGAAALANDSVNSEKIAAAGVTTDDIADGAVTRQKIADGSIPLMGTLRPGQTLRGVFSLGGGATDQAATFRDTQTYQFPMTYAPLSPPANVVDLTSPTPEYTAACPSVSGGNQQTPNAANDQLCFYITAKSSAFQALTVLPQAQGSNRLGFAIQADFGVPVAAEAPYVAGMWAATAR